MELQEVAALLFENGVQFSTTDREQPTGSAADSATRNIPEYLEQRTGCRELEVLQWLKGMECTIHGIPLVRVCRERELLASSAQKELWIRRETEKPHFAHNGQMELCIKRSLDLAVLTRSFNDLTARRESLRTVFNVNGNGEVVQIINEPFPIEIPLLDIGNTKMDQETLEEEINRISLEQEHVEYDLTNGPLFRVCLLQLPANKQILLFSFHRIILDDRSCAILLVELMALYHSLSKDEQRPSTPRLPLVVDYADYAHWEQQWLKSARFDACLDYWKKQLLDMPPSLDFPYDRARSVTADHGSACEPIKIGKVLAKKLYALGERDNVPLHSILLTALNVLLMRYTGQKDITVGAIVPNLAELAKLYLTGPLENIVVLRSDLSGKKTLRELLHEIASLAAEAISQQPIPYSNLIDIVQAADRPEVTSLCQVLLELKATPLTEIEFGSEVVYCPKRRSMGIAGFEIALSLGIVNDTLQGHIEYNTELFDRSTIQRFVQYFRVLLAAMVEDPDEDISTAPLLPDAEKHLVVDGWNQTETIYPQNRCISELFEAWVERTPDAVAITCENLHLSYEELNRKGNLLARYLVAQGVVPEVRVGICVERSPEMIVGILGVLKAGGAYVPIDPGYPKHRIEYLLADSGIGLLLTQQHLLQTAMGDHDISCFCVDRDWAAIEGYCGVNTKAPVGPDNLAYMIYTSGSTGKPKGTLLHHKGLANLSAAQRKIFDINEQSCVIQFASFGFDAATWEWVMALTNGARLCLIHADTAKSAGELTACIQRRGVTHATLPPALLPQLDPAQFPCLTHLIVAGEACPETTAQQWCRGRRFFNAYGPTETTVCASIYRYTGESASISIGRPLPNFRLYILNGRLEPMPIGAVGELYIGGPALARGYHNRADLSGDRFIPDPFSGDAGDRLYRTGDLVRYLPDGNIEYVGRLDNQVKIRGFRIELGEIEAVLLGQSGVREVVVTTLLREQAAATKYIVAYVVLDEGLEPNQEALRLAMMAVLPGYMIPAFFVFLDKLPLTPNGKVNRKALPVPSEVAIHRQVYVAPRTETESLLCEIWEDVLGITPIGIRDNFFASGGDSILSIQVVSKANARGIRISPGQFFDYQTVEVLAQQAVSASWEMPQEPSEGEMTLLPVQQWFFSNDSADWHHYNKFYLLTVPEGFDISFLREAVKALYQRHDALRLRYQFANRCWRASFQPGETVEMDEVAREEPLLGSSLRERQEFVAFRGEKTQASLDINAGRLFKAVYFKADKTKDSRLLLVIHHLVVDGVSWRILLEDLALAFSQRQAGEEIALGPKSSSFQQWGAALSEYSNRDALLRERAYWLYILSCPVKPLPLDHPEVTSRNYETVKEVAISLDETRTSALLTHCQYAYRTRINELLLSGLALAMERWAGRDALRLLMEGHGREALFETLDLSYTVGWFTSMYPLTLHWEPDASLNTLIRAVKEQIRAIPGNGIGYGILRYLRQDEKIMQAEKGSEPEIVFNYLGQFDQQAGKGNTFTGVQEYAGRMVHKRFYRDYKLRITGIVVEGKLRFLLEYDHRQYHRETMDRFGTALRLAFEEIIEHCQQPAVGCYTPSDFPLARLDQSMLDVWQQRYSSLEDIYPATGMQSGLLFHSLIDNAGEAYVTQVCLVIEGNFDPEVFKAAWAYVVSRHSVLRTAFVGLSLETILQLVVGKVKLIWHEEDWKSRPEDEQAIAFEAFRKSDKAKGFELDKPPLMRFSLFRETDGRYRFLWTHHHSLLDGWSLPIILDEVQSSYCSLMKERQPSLPELPPYHNYIRWLQRQDREKAETFWRNELEGIKTPTPLVIDKLPVDPDTAGPQEQSLKLSIEDTAQLLKFARAQRVTLNTVVQGAWAYLLYRYSGERDVVFGETVSGRSIALPGVEKMVGPFINTLPVRVTVDGDLPTGKWLRNLHKSQVQNESYGYVPLVEVQQYSEVEAGIPLFNTLVVFDINPMTDIVEQEKNVSSLAYQVAEIILNEQSNYDLSLLVTPSEQLTLVLRYAGEVCPVSAIVRLLGHLEVTLKGMAGSAYVRELPLFSVAERRRLLLEWNDTNAAYPDSCCIHELFESQVDRNPKATALVYEDQQYSYRELNWKSNQLAHYLIEKGVGQDVKVGLCIERSPEMIIGILGVLKAGGAYVPIDPDYPKHRIEYLLADSGIGLLLTQQHLLQTAMGDHDISCFCVDRDWAAIEGYCGVNTKAPVGPDNLAYMIYTSGSTGKPKGTLLHHKGLANLSAAQRKIFDINEQSCVIQFASFGFDAATWEWVMALTNGARLCLIHADTAKSAGELTACIQRRGVTHATLPPALLPQLDPAQFPCLTHLIVAGEACPETTAQQWCRGRRFFNAYGPTETTVCASIYRYTGESASISIGRPMPNFRLYILNGRLEPMPIGAVGELYVGGPALARGYHNRADLSGDRFIPDPFSGDAGDRLYRTGDLVRYLPDGNIEYVGRLDNQVKVRGFRIELGEIEAVLLGQPGVREVVVTTLLREQAAATKYIAAYVVLEEGAEPDEDALRLASHTVLPDYMVPSLFLFVDELPLTPNGKIDRKALPEPGADWLDTRAYIPPQTEIEQKLVSIWSDVLKLPIDKIGICSNFFKLGGHSLMAAQVIARVQEILPIDVYTQSLFDNPTIKSLAKFIESVEEEYYSLANIDIDSLTDEEADNILKNLVL